MTPTITPDGDVVYGKIIHGDKVKGNIIYGDKVNGNKVVKNNKKEYDERKQKRR